MQTTLETISPSLQNKYEDALAKLDQFLQNN